MRIVNSNEMIPSNS